MALFTEFEVKTFDASTLTLAYQAFGTPLTYPCYEAIISNESNVPVEISIDGTNPIIRVGAGVTMRFKGMNRHPTLDKGIFLWKEATQLYISNKVTGSGFIVVNALMAR